MQALAPLSDDALVVACPIAVRLSPPPTDEWSALRATLQFEMMSGLPALLEGLLDCSPGEDDDHIKRPIGDRSVVGQDADALVTSLGIPRLRVRESPVRLEHQQMEMDMRLRFVMEVTWPDYHPDINGSLQDILDRWKRTIESNEAITCRDVVFREVVGISVWDDPLEYDDWRRLREQHDLMGGSGTGGSKG